MKAPPVQILVTVHRSDPEAPVHRHMPPEQIFLAISYVQGEGTLVDKGEGGGGNDRSIKVKLSYYSQQHSQYILLSQFSIFASCL